MLNGFDALPSPTGAAASAYGGPRTDWLQHSDGAQSSGGGGPFMHRPANDYSYAPQHEQMMSAHQYTQLSRMSIPAHMQQQQQTQVAWPGG